jgi:hypothetical protein
MGEPTRKPTCREVVGLVSDYLEGALTADEAETRAGRAGPDAGPAARCIQAREAILIRSHARAV